VSISDGGYSDVGITAEKLGQLMKGVRGKAIEFLKGELSLFHDISVTIVCHTGWHMLYMLTNELRHGFQQPFKTSDMGGGQAACCANLFVPSLPVNGGADQWSTRADGCHSHEFYCTSVQVERPRTYVFTSGIDARPILTFCNINVVVVLVKYKVYGENITVVVCSTYLLYDSVDPPSS
jgi:hypothetical protein